MENPGETVAKAILAKVFKSAWDISANVENAVKGFKEAGLFPFKPSAVVDNPKRGPSFTSIVTATVDDNASIVSTVLPACHIENIPTALPTSEIANVSTAEAEEVEAGIPTSSSNTQSISEISVSRDYLAKFLQLPKAKETSARKKKRSFVTLRTTPVVYRASGELPRLLCKVDDITGNNHSLFKLSCTYGVLQSCADIGDLELLKNIVDTSEWPETSVLLHESAKKASFPLAGKK
ncbi:unnamed protein product [Mytilus coruscus]|uniref:Uncharacterized protein n=1 Tax=Mytilus coruscus TaxID=42192 RepID=A0A6J8C4L7_MYTCO|nr:unnamed protein product [Mytilus coruscus]